MLLIARMLLAAGKSAIVEGNSTPEWAAEELARLQAKSPFRCVHVLCITEAETCLAPVSGAQRFGPSPPDASRGW